jgi:hypothetical protein
MADPKYLAEFLSDPGVLMRLGLQGSPMDKAEVNSAGGDNWSAFTESAQRDGVSPEKIGSFNVGVNPGAGFDLSLSGQRATSDNGTSNFISPRVGYTAQTPIGDLGIGAAYDMSNFQNQDVKASSGSPRYDVRYQLPITNAFNVGANYSKQSGPSYNAGVNTPLAGGTLSGQAAYSPEQKAAMAYLNWAKRF